MEVVITSVVLSRRRAVAPVEEVDVVPPTASPHPVAGVDPSLVPAVAR